MIHIVIEDTDTGEIKIEKDCIAIVGGICDVNGDVVEYAHAANGDPKSLAFATAAAVSSIQKVFEHDPVVEKAVSYAFGVEDEEGGDEE